MKLSSIPLDVLLIKGEEFNKSTRKKDLLNDIPIKIAELNFEGIKKKTPYSPISTIFSLDFKINEI